MQELTGKNIQVLMEESECATTALFHLHITDENRNLLL